MSGLSSSSYRRRLTDPFPFLLPPSSSLPLSPSSTSQLPFTMTMTSVVSITSALVVVVVVVVVVTIAAIIKDVAVVVVAAATALIGSIYRIIIFILLLLFLIIDQSLFSHQSPSIFNSVSMELSRIIIYRCLFI